MISFAFLALGFAIFYMIDDVLERQKERNSIEFEAKMAKVRNKYAKVGGDG